MRRSRNVEYDKRLDEESSDLAVDEKSGTASGQRMNTVSDSTEDDVNELDAWRGDSSTHKMELRAAAGDDGDSGQTGDERMSDATGVTKLEMETEMDRGPWTHVRCCLLCCGAVQGGGLN